MTFLKMLKSFFKNVFKDNSYEYRLSQYLESKGCTSATCAEYWIKEFERKQRYV